MGINFESDFKCGNRYSTGYQENFDVNGKKVSYKYVKPDDEELDVIPGGVII